MATTDAGERTEDADVDSDVAEVLGDASFVHLLVGADGDAIAAAGVLGRSLAHVGTPYQVSVVGTPDEATRRIAATDGDSTTVSVGLDTGEATTSIDGVPRSVGAYHVAADLVESVAPPGVLALAGAVVTGRDLDDLPGVQEAIRVAGGRHVPGVAVPTADTARGLAYSTLVHGPFSGRPAEAAAMLDGSEAADGVGDRSLASAVAMAVAGPDDTPRRSAGATGRVLRPLVVDGPFQTVGGYADVLSATAHAAPGTAMALALGRDGRTPALEAWEAHGATVHEAVRSVDWRRYADVIVVETDAPAPATARLLRDFRAPEPAVLVRAPDRTALATTETDARRWLAAAVDPTTVAGRPRLATTTDLTDQELDRLTEGP